MKQYLKVFSIKKLSVICYLISIKSFTSQIEIECRELKDYKSNFSFRKWNSKRDDLSKIYHSLDHPPSTVNQNIPISPEEMSKVTINQVEIENGQAKVSKIISQNISRSQLAITDPYLGVDGRTPVENPHQWPNSIHGHMLIKFDKEIYTASGVTVGPRHILTAAHNLYNRNMRKWANEIFFAPGRYRDQFPFSNAKAVKLIVPKKWIFSQDKQLTEDYDFGLIILDFPLGHYTGWSGLLSVPDIVLQNIPLSVTGYPADKGSGSYKATEMYSMTRGLEKLDDKRPEMLLYHIDTYEGQSGGQIGLYINKEKNWFNSGFYTLGIHAYGKNKECSSNRGVRLTKSKFDIIINCIESHFIDEDQWNDVIDPGPRIDYLSFLTTENSPVALYNRIKQGDSDALYMWGKNLEEQEQYKKAFVVYEESADKNHRPAYTALGRLHQNGQGTHANLFKAISFFEEAKGKDTNAYGPLSTILSDEKNGFKQYRLSENIKRLEQAVEKGDAEACFRLSERYRLGNDVYQDEYYASKLRQTAKDRGYNVSEELIVKNHDRPWKRLDEKYLEKKSIIKNLSVIPVIKEFIEAYPENSEKSYLSLLWEKVHQQQSTILTIKALISGMAGIGKTTLAAQYAREAIENQAYKIVYWISADTSEKIIEGYKDLLKKLRVNVEADISIDDLTDLVNQQLELTQPSLLVFDNIVDSIARDLLPIEGNGHIITTSRHQYGWSDTPADFNLNVFSIQDSIRYLLKQTEIQQNSENEKQAGELACELGYHPLALSYASSYIKQKRLGTEKKIYNFRDYLKNFQEQPSSHFEKLFNRNDKSYKTGKKINYEYLVAKTVRMAKDQVSELAKQLLVFFAYLDPDRICTNAFLDYAQNIFQSDQNDLDNAIIELFNFSLIRSDQKISIHRLTQLVIRNEHEDKLPDFDSLLVSFWIYFQNNQQLIEKLKDCLDIVKHENVYQILYELSSNLIGLNKNFEHLKNNTNIFYAKLGCCFTKKLVENSLLNLRNTIFKIVKANESYLQHQQFLKQITKNITQDSPNSIELSQNILNITSKVFQGKNDQLSSENMRYLAECYENIKETKSEYLAVFEGYLKTLMSWAEKNDDIVEQCCQLNLLKSPQLIEYITFAKKNIMDQLLTWELTIDALLQVPEDERLELAKSLTTLGSNQIVAPILQYAIKPIIQKSADQRLNYADTMKPLLAIVNDDFIERMTSFLDKPQITRSATYFNEVLENHFSSYMDKMNYTERKKMVKHFIKSSGCIAFPEEAQNISNIFKISTDILIELAHKKAQKLPYVDSSLVIKISRLSLPMCNLLNTIQTTLYSNRDSDIFEQSSFVLSSIVAEKVPQFTVREIGRYANLNVPDMSGAKYKKAIENIGNCMLREYSSDNNNTINETFEEQLQRLSEEFESRFYLLNMTVSKKSTSFMIEEIDEFANIDTTNVSDEVYYTVVKNFKELTDTLNLRRNDTSNNILQERLLILDKKISEAKLQTLYDDFEFLWINQMVNYLNIRKTMINIPPIQRQDFTYCLKLLLPNQITEAKRHILVDALSKVSADQRKVFTDTIKSFLPKQFDISDSASIISASSLIPMDQLQEIGNSFNSLWISSMNGYECVALIHNIREIPSGKRLEFTNNIKLLLRDYMSKHMRARIIESLIDVFETQGLSYIIDLIEFKNKMLSENIYKTDDWCALLTDIFYRVSQKQRACIQKNIVNFLDNLKICSDRFKSFVLTPILKKKYIQNESLKIFENM